MRDFPQFATLCIRRAFTRSFHLTEQMVSVGGILIGGLGYFGIQVIPHIDGWMITVFLFCGIVCVRLILAPYWLWRDHRAEIQAIQSVKIDGQIQSLEQWVRRQNSFPIGHAACLLAGQTLVAGEPTGVASGHISMLRRKLITGDIQPVGGAKHAIMFAQMAATADGMLDAKPLNPDSIRISKADLRALAVEFDLLVPGLTATAVPAHQSLPDTAIEVQR